MLIRKGCDRIRLLACLIFLLALLPACTQALGPVPGGFDPAQVSGIGTENNTVHVGIHLIDMYNFQYQTGRYTYDMYVFFFWTDPNIATADWYLMNGYPTFPGAKLLVDADRNGSVKWELYRARADLNAPIEPTNYPFDRITLPVSIELLTHNYPTTLVWMDKETGIDTGFTNVGWSRPAYMLNTSVSHYPLGIDSPRVDMLVVMDRNPFGGLVKTIFPPLVFCFVAAVCFLFRMHDASAFTLRVGITTSMLVSAVLFIFAEQGDIPPVSQLTFFHVFMAATISFLALGLVTTVLGYVEWMRTNDKAHVDRINRAGFVVSVILPVLFFAVLFLTK
jgi:hypothetical protein